LNLFKIIFVILILALQFLQYITSDKHLVFEKKSKNFVVSNVVSKTQNPKSTLPMDVYVCLALPNIFSQISSLSVIYLENFELKIDLKQVKINIFKVINRIQN